MDFIRMGYTDIQYYITKTKLGKGIKTQGTWKLQIAATFMITTYNITIYRCLNLKTVTLKDHQQRV